MQASWAAACTCAAGPCVSLGGGRCGVGTWGPLVGAPEIL